MAELADALDLGSSGESRAGSSPVIRIKKKHSHLRECFFFMRTETLKPVQGLRFALLKGSKD